MAKKANNVQNLRPFKKGESGNPSGRPPKLPEIDEMLARVLQTKTHNGLSRAENILRLMAIKAETDVRAAELILDRAYGKIKQQTEHSGSIALPITGMQIIKDDSKTETSRKADSSG
jgi:hypothetical protein